MDIVSNTCEIGDNLITHEFKMHVVKGEPTDWLILKIENPFEQLRDILAE